ncbi:hypothetical protein D9757_004877 [Collybiopsis confluens]|uniref:ATP-dependent DNA helicase n=1 Tax=Collybiopsis confluens TaxID=2823264 RepID=A0A8H5HTP2_9AGAR|nr:hypothetical protein D9757_004877 [Collybiopsis confluens]
MVDSDNNAGSEMNLAGTDMERLLKPSTNVRDLTHAREAVAIAQIAGIFDRIVDESSPLKTQALARKADGRDTEYLEHWRSQMAVKRQQINFMDDVHEEVPSDSLFTLPPDVRTMADIIGEANDHRTPPNEEPPCAPETSLDAVEKAMLNVDQRRAFDIVEWHLKSTMAKENIPRLRMIIYGEGGTGKSKVIQSITWMFSQRGGEEMLVKSSYTGVAASLVDGKTLHNIANLNQRGKLSETMKKKMQERWRQWRYLIIDKYSMISKTIFAKLSRNVGISVEGLTHANRNDSFGGINVIIVGDLHQFEPVVCGRHDALYYPTQNSDTELMKIGREIYEDFDTVVIVKEQRRVSDEVWRDFLRRLRQGVVQEGDLAMLKKLVITGGECDTDFSRAPWSNASLITPRHATRVEWNEAAVRAHCKESGEVLYRCEAEDRHASGTQATATDWERRLLKSRLNQKINHRRLSDVVELAKGMKVMVTFNVDTDLDITNGARGEIVDIVLDENESAMEGSSEVQLRKLPRLKELSGRSNSALDKLADPFTHPIRRTSYSKWKDPTKTSRKDYPGDRVEARQRKAKSVNPSSDNRGRTRKPKEKATVDEPEGPSIGAYPKSPAVRSASQDDDDQFREQPESPLTPIGESPNSNNEQGPNPFNFESINLASTQTPTLSFDYPSIFSSWFQSSFPNLNLSHSISSTSHPILLSSTNMSNRNNIPQIGLPTLSNDAVTQLAAAAEKLPKLYKTPPILNIEDPVGVIQWFEAAEWIFDSNGITSDDAKLKLALDWSTYPTRKLFMGMKSVRTPNYDEFVKEVRNILPEEMLDVAGSMYKLDRIVNEYEPLSIRQKAEFRLYNVLFVIECEKLMTDRPILANRDAVRTYLKVFEESTRSMVFDQVRRDVKPATIGNRRKEDPITLKEAVAAAEKVFSLSNYESIYGLTSVRSSGIGSTNPESYRRSQIAYPLTSGLPAQSNFDYLKSVRKIKQENDVEGGISDLWKSASKDSVNEKEKLEFEKERLASQQDVNEAWLKEMRQMTLKVGEGLSTVASLVGAAVSQRQPNLEGNQNRYGFNQSGPSGSSARYGNTYSNTGPRQLLCFMCRAKDHLLAACPIYQDYVKRGWLVPEGNGSTRMKLRDEVRMPRDDENTPRYKLIEDIAKARGWGKAESYFANMVDEEEDEMNRQLDSEDQVQVLLRELAEAKNAMLQMSQQRPSEELGKKLLDSMKEPRPGRGIYQIGRNHASSFVQAPESSFSKKPNNTNNDRRGPPPRPLKSAFKKKVAFDGVLMPPRDRFDGIPNRNFRRTRDTSTEIESEPAEKVRTEVVSKEQPSAGYGDIRPSPATAKRPFDDVRPITFRPPPETDVRNRRSEVPNSQALDQSQPSPMSEEREKSKQPSYRVRNELFKDGLAEEVATKVLEGTVQLSIEEMLGISSLVKKILERKLKNRRVEPKRGKSAYVAVLTDNGETEIPEMPTGVLMRGNYIDIDDLALEPEIMFEYLSEARDGMPIGSWTIKICPIL